VTVEPARLRLAAPQDPDDSFALRTGGRS
jgi:hypothetical protein